VRQCTTLDSGLRIVTERMDHVASASVGFYVRTGSSDERPDEGGISHFIEHLVFKGTAKRSALDIVLAFDRVGGDVNAATEREITYYYGRVLGRHLPMAVDAIADMLACPKLAPEDIDLELAVVAEEICQNEDSPAELVHDHFAATLWPGHPLGRPILGRVEALEALGREGLLDYLRRRYVAKNVTVSAAGDVHHDQVVELVGELLDAKLPPGVDSAETPTPSSAGGVFCDERDIEQVHLCVGVPAFAARDERRLAQAVTDCALGGASSSRLFQEIREKRGLVYAVYSSVSLFLGIGNLVIYAGTRPENVPQVLELVSKELDDVAHHGLTDTEVENAKEQYKGSTLMSLDSVHHRMARNARGLIAFGRPIPAEELIARIDAVRPDDVRAVTAELFGSQGTTVVAIGPIRDGDLRAAAGSLIRASG